VRTERTCSLSSTQRMVFLGRMQSHFCRMSPCGGSRRLARPGHLLVCRCNGGGRSKKKPRGSAGSRLRRVVGRLLGRRETQSARLCCLLRRGTVTLVRRMRLPNHGVRERLWADAGCHANPRAHGPSVLRIQRGQAQRMGWTGLRLQTVTVRAGSCDCEAVQLLSTQIVRKQAKELISNVVANSLQGRRQRFPTVRRVT